MSWGRVQGILPRGNSRFGASVGPSKPPGMGDPARAWSLSLVAAVPAVRQAGPIPALSRIVPDRARHYRAGADGVGQDGRLLPSHSGVPPGQAQPFLRLHPLAHQVPLPPASPATLLANAMSQLRPKLQIRQAMCVRSGQELPRAISRLPQSYSRRSQCVTTTSLTIRAIRGHCAESWPSRLRNSARPWERLSECAAQWYACGSPQVLFFCKCSPCCPGFQLSSHWPSGARTGRQSYSPPALLCTLTSWRTAHWHCGAGGGRS